MSVKPAHPQVDDGPITRGKGLDGIHHPEMGIHNPRGGLVYPHLVDRRCMIQPGQVELKLGHNA